MKNPFKKYRIYWWPTYGSEQHPYPSPEGFRPTRIFVKGRNAEEAMNKARKVFIDGQITNCVITVRPA